MARSTDLTGWLTLLADGLSTEFGVAAATPNGYAGKHPLLEATFVLGLPRRQ
jgi:hypothetical protein